MPFRRIGAQYEQLSEFERGRIIGLEKGVWTNRRIARHMGRSDAAIRRCWREWTCLKTARAACRSWIHYCPPQRSSTRIYGLGCHFIESRNPLSVIRGTLAAHRYVDGILRTVLLPFLLQYPCLILRPDNAKHYTTRVAMNCLTAYQTLPCPVRSPDPSPIEHVWDMMGRRLHLPGNVDDQVRKLEQI
ncbi:transposable element Tcb1 transposase [Trichonephila clavipes]|nr:transposable element Tcb1 transposase [Trichonephila clavipes]